MSRLMILFGILFFFNMLSFAVDDDPIVVNSNRMDIANDGLCTLPEAILSANNDFAITNPDNNITGECRQGEAEDTILLKSGETYTLSGRTDLPENDTRYEYGPTGLPLIHSVLILTTDAQEPAIIERSKDAGEFRLVEVGRGGNFTVKNVTLRGGLTSENNGGALLNWGHTTLENVTVEDNMARWGGGLSNPLTMTIRNSLIQNNTASTTGGGISATANLTIENTRITGNHAHNGGGIQMDGFAVPGLLVIINSEVSDNEATESGGGIYGLVTVLDFNTVTIRGNRAGLMGGGMFINDFDQVNNFNLTNSIITGNEAQTGGGLYMAIGTMTMNNSSISGNVASEWGNDIVMKTPPEAAP